MKLCNDTQLLRDIRADLHREILLVCSKYEMTSELGNIVYEKDGNECRVKITIRPRFTGAMNDDNPFNPPIPGSRFRYKGEHYTYEVYKKRRPKFPHTLVRDDGKRFKWGDGVLNIAVKVK